MASAGRKSGWSPAVSREAVRGSGHSWAQGLRRPGTGDSGSSWKLLRGRRQSSHAVDITSRQDTLGTEWPLPLCSSKFFVTLKQTQTPLTGPPVPPTCLPSAQPPPICALVCGHITHPPPRAVTVTRWPLVGRVDREDLQEPGPSPTGEPREAQDQARAALWRHGLASPVGPPCPVPAPGILQGSWARRYSEMPRAHPALLLPFLPLLVASELLRP